jgi:hypothetical protein
VAIVNDVLARRVWPQSSAVGQPVVLDGVSHTVIGVVPDTQYYAAGEAPRPQVFLSYWQPHSDDPFLNDSRTLLRVAGDATQMMPAIHRAIASVDPNVPLSENYPLRDRVDYMFQPVRLARMVLVGFAGLAVLLSAVGLYGVLAFSVAQRRREIGVRVALGANPSRIARLVLREGAMVTSAGNAAGVAGAWVWSRLLPALLYGVDARDPLAFAVATLLIGAAAAVACVIPARRAARVPAAVALRCD